MLYPLKILVAAIAGWITRQQNTVIDYLREENRVLKEQLRCERLRLTDAQHLGGMLRFYHRAAA